MEQNFLSCLTFLYKILSLVVQKLIFYWGANVAKDKMTKTKRGENEVKLRGLGLPFAPFAFAFFVFRPF